MKYLFLLYADETAPRPDPTSPEAQAMFAAYGAFTAETTASGAFQGGDPVLPSSTAVTVSVADGATSSTAGPALAGDEQLIGFYVLEVSGEEEAIALAAKIPAAMHGKVEARPIMVM
jgi:hypothetical protein